MQSSNLAETEGLSWWENVLIVVGVLVGFALIGIAVHYAIGLPGSRPRLVVRIEHLRLNDDTDPHITA